MNPRALPELLHALLSQWWSSDRLQRLQTRRLRKMLHHAVSSVPYYRALRIDPGSEPAEQALLRFPYLTKRDLQIAGAALVADDYRSRPLQTSRTSGSTGEPTTTWFDNDSWRYTKHVLKWRRFLATINPLGQRLLLVTETPPEKLRGRTGLPGIGEMMPLSVMTPMAEAVATVRRFRPTALYAFPSWLRELIDTAQEQGVELPPASCVMTSSEVLTAADRDAIAAALSAPVSDVYGTTEFKEVAWQCRAGRYHVNVESVWVEIDAPVGDVGEVVLTGLVNRAMPLIRFRTGDLARWEYGKCPCGRAAPAIADIQGRVMEMMRLPGGHRLSPYLLTTAIEQDTGIRHYLIEQHGEDRVVIRYRTGPAGPVHEGELIAKVQQILGPGICVSCLHDPSLVPPAKGKRSIYRRL